MNLQTVTQAAAALGISPRRVRQLISAGAIAAARAGGRLWLITPETLAEFARLERRAPPGLYRLLLGPLVSGGALEQAAGNGRIGFILTHF